jgi:H+-transporting ATPase
MSLSVSGLTSDQAASRLARYGRNEMAEERESPFKRLVKHFWAPVPWMLETTIMLQFAFGGPIEAGLITVLLIFNVLLGVFQETGQMPPWPCSSSI